MTRKPGEGLEQLALPFEGQTGYYGYCAVCWSDEFLDGPHLVGMCAECRRMDNEPKIPWEETVQACLRNELKYPSSFDENGRCYLCDHPREEHQNR